MRCFRMSRDLLKPHATSWKSVRCYVTTTVLLGYICPSIRFNLNLCSSVGDETCQPTRTISLSIMRSHFAYLRKNACKWSVFEQNWRRFSFYDLGFWQPWKGKFLFWYVTLGRFTDDIGRKSIFTHVPDYVTWSPGRQHCSWNCVLVCCSSCQYIPHGLFQCTCNSAFINT